MSKSGLYRHVGRSKLPAGESSSANRTRRLFVVQTPFDLRLLNRLDLNNSVNLVWVLRVARRIPVVLLQTVRRVLSIRLLRRPKCPTCVLVRVRARFNLISA